AQLKYYRPDLRFVTIRGNVDTRLRKLEAGEADALVLACAGLDRLGRSDVITERLSLDLCLPQVGQACVTVHCRVDDGATTARLASACDHEATRRAVVLERQLLALLGGGCTVPVAAHARPVRADTYRLTARVATPDGKRVLTAEAEGESSDSL